MINSKILSFHFVFIANATCSSIFVRSLIIIKRTFSKRNKSTLMNRVDRTRSGGCSSLVDCEFPRRRSSPELETNTSPCATGSRSYRNLSSYRNVYSRRCFRIRRSLLSLSLSLSLFLSLFL